MTAPDTAVTMDELEATAGSAAPAAPDLTKITLTGDDLPEPIKGKSVADMVAYTRGLQEALRTSETARQQSENVAKLATSRVGELASQPAPAPAPAPELSDDDLNKMYEENPIQAIRMMNQQAIRKAAAMFETRLEPLFNGTASSAEAQAKQKYTTEFGLFGDEIKELVERIPNKAAMSSSQGWDDLISYVRGRPGNHERLMAHHKDAEALQRRTEAQKRQVDEAGFTATSQVGTRRPNSPDQLDPIQKEIADKLGMTLEDYVKWMI
jgi:Skp family chaperone for outer membrane proteins